MNALGANLDVVCTPCQHFSGRGLLDRNKTLWASWVVDAKGKRFFFGGDTAYRAVPKGADEATVPTCPAFKGTWQGAGAGQGRGLGRAGARVRQGRGVGLGWAGARVGQGRDAPRAGRGTRGAGWAVSSAVLTQRACGVGRT